jgi:hypothetical protein
MNYSFSTTFDVLPKGEPVPSDALDEIVTDDILASINGEGFAYFRWHALRYGDIDFGPCGALYDPRFSFCDFR